MMRSTVHRSSPSHYSGQSSKIPGRYRWSSVFLGIASAVLAAIPARAADQIVFAIDQLEFYLPVSSLEAYVETGKADADLAFYLRFLKPEDRVKFRTLLQTIRQRTPLAVSQFLYSPMGAEGLRSLGDVIQTGPQQNGFYGLRAAMIQAAANPEGLSVLGVMKAFPAKSIRINVPLALQVLKDVSHDAKLSGDVLQTIQTQAKATAAREPVVDTAALPAIQNPGPYAVTKQTLPLVDSRRNNRPVPTDLYVPDFRGNPPASIPVVVFSPGLGETRTFTAPFQEYLASYGFIVAAPDHIGSDAAQEERLLKGASSDIFLVSAFYNRPLDVSFVLDTLAQKNATEFGGRLNLNRVGVYGHSFGGYDVFVLGGATVDFKHLEKQCQGDYLVRSLNPSYLLQCRALELKSSPQAALLSSGQLRDPRVQLVAAISPVGSAMLGPSGMGRIQVPVLIFGGADDTAAPYVAEQVKPFGWLTTQNKYLLVSNDISHTPELTEKIDQVVLPKESSAELDAQLARFMKDLRGIGLALMQVYVAEKSEYSPYLLSSYTQTLQDPPFKFSLIRSFPPNRLQELERHGSGK